MSNQDKELHPGNCLDSNRGRLDANDAAERAETHDVPRKVCLRLASAD